ncbi:CDK5 regulatory subunit-associated protein 2 isoform X2 [Gopherus flavomarginatus]|uniref:CDK5 regulatory subunit-associated protein 2 isoform X2 n=1 Tax=Gopherus flavomarginatus TaxID=286002 RepID=UPI0021CC21C2|nr:CDK5 regulatory subunit-associated protein 2 isoform X2 [Gopherus flavomarginatus]
MDSLPGEDLTLPVEFSGSVSISRLSDVSRDEPRIGLGISGALLDVAEDAISPTRARTMKDYENQITDLKKENFNLKLRIYFLEEQMQQKFDGPTEDIYKINIELKVEVESLKRDLQEREKLLIKASKAVESLAQGGDAEIQRVKEEARKKVQQVEEILTSRINLLEENLKAAQEEVEKAFAVTEREKVLRLAVEQKLSGVTNTHLKELDSITELPEKDRLIEQLTLSLKSKEAIIQHLEEEKSQSESCDGNLPAEKIRELTVALRHEKDSEIEAIKMELRNERNFFEKKIQSLQEELRERENELSIEKKNGLKRDKTIQGLTLALKTKEKENEELNSEIENLNVSLAKAREATHKAQIQKFKGAEDYQALLMEKETLLAELRSENLTKDTENRKLQRRIKRTDQELNDLNLEREKMERELDEAQLQKSRGDKTINDLRNQLEKLHGEMTEREKAVEHHYNILLSESNQKLQSQELVIKRLTDSVSQKDLLLQKLDAAIKEKDVELQELIKKCKNLLKAKEDLELKNEDLIKEKCASESQQSIIKIVKELEEKKESEYEELILVLRKEQHIYSTLVKTLKDSDSINSLQTELNNIFLLRKQLEEDIVANQNLRKVLEDQIKNTKNREDETFSFCGDQTSYMSICLGEHDHLNLQVDHLSLEELKKKVAELILMVKDLHSVNQELKKKQLRLSRSETQGKETLKIINQNEFLERTEETMTQAGDFDNKNAESCQRSERTSEACPQLPLDHPLDLDMQIPPSDYSDGVCKDRHYRNPNKPRFEHDIAGKHFGRIEMGEHEVEEMSLLTSLLNENGTSVLESRQEQMKIVISLLDHLSTTEQDCSSEDIENKDEKDLRQMIIQLRAELRHFKQVNKILKQQVELKSTSDGKEKLYPDTAPQVNKDIELLKVELKDTATQTMTIEGNVMRLKHEGKRGASEEKTKYSRLNAEPQQENAYKKGEQHESLSVTSRTNKSDFIYPFKKSRLPIPLKSSRSLGNIPLTSCTQKPDMHLQHRLMALDEGLKERKIQNKQLHKELSLCGSVIETVQEKPEEERVLVRAESLVRMDCKEIPVDSQAAGFDTHDKNENKIVTDQRTSQETEMPHNISDMNILHSLKELNKEFYSMDNQDIDSATTNSGSKSLLSLKLSVPSTDAFDDYEVIDDLEELRQRIKDMKSELEKYKMFIFHLQPTNPFLSSDIFNIVLNDAELPIERHVIQMQDTDGQETQTFSTVHQQVDYEIRIENLNSQSAETPDEQTSQNLKQLLLENEAELEREQIANMHLLDEVYRLQNKLRETSPSKYDSLVHSQARELSFQRQQIKEIHSICVTYHQHLTSLIKAFEELLQASDVDYYVAEGFREQLNQSVQLFEKLEKKFLYGESLDAEVAKLYELAQRDNEKTTTMHQQLKDESPIPSAFHSLSDFEMSEKSSIGSPEPKQDLLEEDKLALVPSKFPPALLMEHLQEIRSLRQRLEDSIKTNERLRLQLERQVTDIELNQGSANIFIHGSEQHNSLTSEIHFLRKQNQVLNVMLAKGSRDKQKENEKLRESLSKKNAIIEHLHQDYECFKKENEKLQKQIGKKEDENRHLTHEIYSSHNELNRLQTEMNVKQHQLSENDKLLQSLRVELKVYEKLDEARRRRTDILDPGHEEFQKDQNNPLDLHELLTEIQSLRVQLERSIETNKTLHEKLEEQLSKEKREEAASVSAVNINYLLKRDSQHYTRMNEVGHKFSDPSSNVCELQNCGHGASPGKAGTPKDKNIINKQMFCIPETQLAAKDDLDSSSRCSSSSSTGTSCTPRLVPGHRMWADKNGRHILGLIEDYNALRKQISEGQKLVSEMEAPLREITGMKNLEPGVKVPDQESLNNFSANIHTVQQNLEEAARLLKLLWRVSLPMKVVHSTAHCSQEEGMKAEILRLHKKLSEQEKKLHSTVKRLHSTNQLKENMEKVIIDQLALTHDVLKKARGNLEVQPAENQKAASHTNKKRIL